MMSSPESKSGGMGDQPDRFDRMTSFLRQRSLLRPAQQLMAALGVASAVIGAADFVVRGPSTWFAVAAAAVAIGVSTAVAAFWLTRWPTRLQSAGFTIAGVLTIVAWSATQPTTTVAAITCAAMVIVGGYAAFFHGPRLLAFTLAAAVSTTAYAAVRICRDDGVQAALTSFWLIAFVNVMVPLALGGTSRAMSAYAVRSDEDPLTGLLNRRAFVEAIGRRIVETTTTGTVHVTMSLVDIDDFKRINDTHGHGVGDVVLQDIAALLRAQSPPSALICRAGGEEFLIASLSASAGDEASFAQRTCTAISAAPHAITVSIGSATALIDGSFDGPAVDAAIEELIVTADHAMYAAKRNGGNQVQHA